MTPENTGRQSHPSLVYALVVLAVTLAAIFMYGRIHARAEIHPGWDLHDYQAMAVAAPGLTSGARDPFVYRILGPYLAGILPVPADEGFMIVSTAAAVCLAMLFFAYLLHAGISPLSAASATLLFVLNKYMFGFPVWNYFQAVDLLVAIAILLMFWTLQTRRWISFAAALLVGALTKEPALLVIPAAIVYAVESRVTGRDRRALALACIPALAAWCALRIFLHPESGDNLITAFGMFAGKAFQPEALFRLLINSIVPVTLLPVVFVGVTREYFRSRKFALLFLALVLLSTLFASHNERLISPGFIVIYMVIGTIFDSVGPSAHGLALWSVVAGVVSSLHHSYARFPISRELTIVLSIGSLAALTTYALVIRNRSYRPEFPPKGGITVR